MIGGIEGVGDPAQVIDGAAGRVGIADHAPLQGIGGSHIAVSGCRGAVRIPGVLADDHHQGCCGNVPVVTSDVEAKAIGFDAVQLCPHALEVGEPARGEVIALRCLDIDLVKVREIVVVAARDLDAGLLGLADIATPQLIEAREHVVETAVREIDLEDIPGLHVTETCAVRLLLHPVGRTKCVDRGCRCS